MRGEAKITLPKDCFISLPCDTVLWTHIVFTRVLLRIRVSFCLRWIAKIEQYVHIKFRMKLSKSTTETREMPCEAFGEHSLRQTAVFEWHSHFKAGWVSVEDDEHSEWSSTSKTTAYVENTWELIHKDHRWTIHELADTFGISYGVFQEKLTENSNMCRVAPSSWQCARPNVPEICRVCD
jgi:hypothetical protein